MFYHNDHGSSINRMPETDNRGSTSKFTALGTELIRLDQFRNELVIDNIISLELIATSKSGAIMLGVGLMYTASAQDNE